MYRSQIEFIYWLFADGKFEILTKLSEVYCNYVPLIKTKFFTMLLEVHRLFKVSEGAL